MIEITTDQKTLTSPCEELKKDDYHIFNALEECLLRYPDGVGLAAPQIGILKRAFIIKSYKGFLRFANPQIVKGENLISSIEGCLSIPEKIFKVDRYENIVFKDEINDIHNIYGTLSIIFQHEYDHINGITLLQKGKLILINTDVNCRVV